MSIVGNSNDFPTIYAAAESYIHNGYGVIPVHTDPGRTKVAAVAWSSYQQRRPTLDDLRHWFVEQEHTGLAIVTGTISRLVVLDFDDLALFDRFQRLCPDLAETRIIRTKRGVHLYFHTPAGQSIQSQRGQGVDLKSQGGYVIAPPTVIDGHAYTILQDRPPLSLRQSDLTRIQAFIHVQATTPAISTAKSQEGPFSCEIEATVESCNGSQTPIITSSGLMNQYRYETANGGRNDALFYTALRARDNGYAMEETIDLLADCHARQAPHHAHKHETYRQRHLEAIATITSAYSRPPRRPVEQGRTEIEQLPNSVREALFQLKQTYAVRVIEGLRLAGIQPGQAFTTQQALKLLAGQVGKHSVYSALNACSGDNEVLFNRQNLPLHSLSDSAHAESQLVKDQSKNCILEEPNYRKKGLYHRPARIFTMPGNHELCAKLGVKLTWSDPLTNDDLASAKQTRMALHRELIRRRPGMYPRKWLGRRLGISDETIDAYNRDIPINVRHCFYEKSITWHNLSDIPLALDIPGTFLEIENGKRYPANREISRKLLAQKHRVLYCRQDINFYSYGDPPRQFPQARIPQPQPATIRPQVVQNGYTGGKLHNRYVPTEPFSAPAGQTKPLPFIESLPPLIFRDETAAQRRLAEKLYKAVRKLSSDPSQHISEANAQRLVETYGIAAVEKGIKKLMWYAQKGKMSHPAGFLITTSRLAWRELHHATEMSVSAPRFKVKKD